MALVIDFRERTITDDQICRFKQFYGLYPLPEGHPLDARLWVPRYKALEHGMIYKAYQLQDDFHMPPLDGIGRFDRFQFFIDRE